MTFVTFCDFFDFFLPFLTFCDFLDFFEIFDFFDFLSLFAFSLPPFSPPLSYHSSHHPQEVLLAQFSLYVHKGGLKLH